MNGGALESHALADLVDDTIGGLWGNPPDSDSPGETDVLVIRGADFRDWNTRRALDAVQRRIAIRSLERRQLQPGDLVVEVSGGSPAQPVGRVLAIDDRAISETSIPLICSNFCRKLRLKPGTDPFFVSRQLQWLYGSGHTDQFQTSTTNIRNLQVADFLSGTEIVLPEPELQAALTALLDTAEDRRASSSEHVRTGRRAIDRFRQSVLAAACAGRLTEDWPGSAGVANWQQVRLDEVCESITDGDHQAPPQVETGVPFITISAINDGQLRLEKATRSVTNAYYEALKPARRPKRGDVLFSVTGSIGIPALVETDERFTFQRHIAILRPNASRIRSKYLLYALGSPDIRKQGLTVATGTAQLTIPLGGLRGFVIPLPALAEQDEVVQRVEQLLAMADDMRRKIDIASDRIDRSSQAVLAKAFRGELIVSAEAST